MKLWQISEFMSTQLWLPGLDNLPALSVLSIRVQAIDTWGKKNKTLENSPLSIISQLMQTS